MERQWWIKIDNTHVLFQGCLHSKDVFSNLLELCIQHDKVIKQVFPKPEKVMDKFLLNLMSLKLQEYISEKLGECTDNYSYLRTLYDLYSKTVKLTGELSSFNVGTDKDYLKPSFIFQKHLDKYIGCEMKCLRDRSVANLQKYYEGKNHQKKQIQSGGFQDLRRDLQAVIGTRANINIAQVENYGGETFLSEELAITILQDTKQAFHRCQLVRNHSSYAFYESANYVFIILVV